MSEVVIDLGEFRPDEDLPDRPFAMPPRRWRFLLVAVAVLCATTLTGSVRRAELSPVTRIPVPLGAVTFIGDHEYFVVADTDQAVDDPVQNNIITVYALPSGALLSRTSVSVTGSIRQVLAVGSLILVTYEADDIGTEATAAYAAGTEVSVWRRYGRLFGLAPSRRAVMLHEVSAGMPTARWSGIDVRTGALIWQFIQPRTDAAELVGGLDSPPDRLVSVTAAGRIEARSLNTGKVIGVSEAHPGWFVHGRYIGMAAGLVLMGEASGTTAYALSDLRERWHSGIDLSSSQLWPGCGDIICVAGYAGGLRVLDSATGRQRWAADGWVVAEQFGPVLLASDTYEQTGTQSFAVLDSVDGRKLSTLSGWRPAGGTRADGNVPVTRDQPELQRVWYGLLDPSTLRVRVLGAAEQVTGSCSSTSDVLVCRRVDASSGVWPFVQP